MSLDFLLPPDPIIVGQPLKGSRPVSQKIGALQDSKVGRSEPRKAPHMISIPEAVGERGPGGGSSGLSKPFAGGPHP